MGGIDVRPDLRHRPCSRTPHHLRLSVNDLVQRLSIDLDFEIESIVRLLQLTYLHFAPSVKRNRFVRIVTIMSVSTNRMSESERRRVRSEEN